VKKLFLYLKHIIYYILVPQTSIAGVVTVKNQVVTKLSMYYTNCHHTNHNMKTYMNRKEDFTIVVAKMNAQVAKPSRPLNYPCHVA